MKKGLILAGQLGAVAGTAALTWHYILRDFLFHSRDVRDGVIRRARLSLRPHRVDAEVLQDAAALLTQCVEQRTPAGIHGDWKVSWEKDVPWALRLAFPRMGADSVAFHSMAFERDAEGKVTPEDFVIGLLLVDEGSSALFEERAKRLYRALALKGDLNAESLRPALDLAQRLSTTSANDAPKPNPADFVTRCNPNGSGLLSMDQFVACQETAKWFKHVHV